MMEYNVIPILFCLLMAGVVMALVGYLIGYVIDKIVTVQETRRREREDARLCRRKTGTDVSKDVPQDQKKA